MQEEVTRGAVTLIVDGAKLSPHPECGACADAYAGNAGGA